MLSAIRAKFSCMNREQSQKWQFRPKRPGILGKKNAPVAYAEGASSRQSQVPTRLRLAGADRGGFRLITTGYSDAATSARRVLRPSHPLYSPALRDQVPSPRLA